MGLKQRCVLWMVRFSCFNARKLYQIGVNNGGVFNAQMWVLSRAAVCRAVFQACRFRV